MDGFSDPLRDLIILIPQLYFLEDWERYWVYENHTSIDTWRVNHKYLLIMVRKTQEPRLGIVECVFVVLENIVLASLVGADGYSFLRKTGALLNVPDF